MKNAKIIILFLTIYLFNYTYLDAQNVITSSGGNAKSNNGSVSYTIGQIFYSTYSGANGSLAQGVQQPYEISVTTSASEQFVLKLNCTLYPNPASDNVILKLENYCDNKLEYELYSSSAILIKKDKIMNSETNIDMNSLSPSVYLLNVIENDILVASFKIIKNF